MPKICPHAQCETKALGAAGRLHILQRARMPQRLLSVQADDSRMAAPSIEGMLRPLPFRTIGDVARHGLELHVYCSCCSRHGGSTWR
jgi:hypothetical protein